jgi:hypothetical protein
MDYVILIFTNILTAILVYDFGKKIGFLHKMELDRKCDEEIMDAIMELETEGKKLAKTAKELDDSSKEYYINDEGKYYFRNTSKTPRKKG